MPVCIYKYLKVLIFGLNAFLSNLVAKPPIKKHVLLFTNPSADHHASAFQMVNNINKVINFTLLVTVSCRKFQI